MVNKVVEIRWLCLLLALAAHGALLLGQQGPQQRAVDAGGNPGHAMSLRFALAPPAPAAALAPVTPATAPASMQAYSARHPVKPQPEPATSVTDEPAAPANTAHTPQKTDSQASNAPAAPHKDSGLHPAVITSDPMFAHTPAPPRYPTIARKRGQQGTVWVDVWLDEQGQQINCQLHQSSGYQALDKAAVQAVSQWRFEAHAVNGRKRASIYRIPIEFSLQAS